LTTISHCTPTVDVLPSVGARLQDGASWVQVFARAHLPTRWGDFEIFVCRNSQDDKEHLALVRGAVQGALNLPVRLHSECLTGDTLGSLRCDCRDQLEMTMQAMGQGDVGMLLYMRQEGRGIGLGQKIRAYALQQQGLDTVEANLHLGFDNDLRDYQVAAMMLKLFGVGSVVLATNNPRKIFALRSYGIEVSGRTPVVAVKNVHNSVYLATKAHKSGHML
jgi:GTP cyclohydrolase II